MPQMHLSYTEKTTTFKFDTQNTDRKGFMLHELVYDKKRELFHQKNF